MHADAGESGTQASSAQGSGARAGERRRGRSRFHIPERRTGFDRRRHYPLTGALRDRPLLLLGVLAIVNTLSAIDFALTYIQLEAGIAQEANPVLAGMFAEAPAKAWLFKTVVILGVSLVIWQQRKHRAMLGVALVALGIYAALIAYHVIGMQLVALA